MDGSKGAGDRERVEGSRAVYVTARKEVVLVSKGGLQVVERWEVE